jgi:PEGA domain
MKRAILAAAVVLSAARCATMVNDTTEKIPVRSTPSGAVVSVDCGNAPLYGGVTPTTITVPRTATPCSITLAKEGYVETRVNFQRQLSRAVGANRVAAAPVGMFAAVLGYALASAVEGLNADAIAGSIYSAGTAIAAAPADEFDARKGGAYKQVPGEVDVTLEPEPTTPSPPR